VLKSIGLQLGFRTDPLLANKPNWPNKPNKPNRAYNKRYLFNNCFFGLIRFYFFFCVGCSFMMRSFMKRICW